MSIERVGVVGAGQMGAGIAEVSAKAGADVIVYEPTDELVTAGRKPHHRSRWSARRRKGKLTEGDRDAALAQADVHHRPGRPGRPPAGHRGGRRGRDRQGEDLRRTRRGDHRPRRGAGVEHVEHPDHENRCGDEESEPGARPALLQPGAGAAAGRTRSARWSPREEAAARTEQFASEVLGKQVVRCADRSGFIVNALLVPYLLSAIRMAEAGVATVEDIDKAVVAGLSHPMGPLRLSDLIGLDTMKLIADSMYDEFKEPHLRSAAVAVAHGRGRPTGQEIGPGLLHVLSLCERALYPARAGAKLRDSRRHDTHLCVCAR